MYNIIHVQLAYKSDMKLAVFSPISGDPETSTIISKLRYQLNSSTIMLQ